LVNTCNARHAHLHCQQKAIFSVVDVRQREILAHNESPGLTFGSTARAQRRRLRYGLIWFIHDIGPWGLPLLFQKKGPHLSVSCRLPSAPLHTLLGRSLFREPCIPQFSAPIGSVASPTLPAGAAPLSDRDTTRSPLNAENADPPKRIGATFAQGSFKVIPINLRCQSVLVECRTACL